MRRVLESGHGRDVLQLALAADERIAHGNDPEPRHEVLGRDAERVAERASELER